MSTLEGIAGEAQVSQLPSGWVALLGELRSLIDEKVLWKEKVTLALFEHEILGGISGINAGNF